jgi:hypothetical protein
MFQNLYNFSISTVLTQFKVVHVSCLFTDVVWNGRLLFEYKLLG